MRCSGYKITMLAPGEGCDAGGVIAAAAVAQASLAPDVQIVRVQLDGSAALACMQSELSHTQSNHAVPATCSGNRRLKLDGLCDIGTTGEDEAQIWQVSYPAEHPTSSNSSQCNLAVDKNLLS